MTKEDHYLLILGEEGIEVAHMVSKCLRFSLEEIRKDQPFTNRERLNEEVSQLEAIIDLLRKRNILPPRDQKAYDEKPAKVEKYLEISKRYGRLSEVAIDCSDIISTIMDIGEKLEEGNLTQDVVRELGRDLIDTIR